jgi:hypothetical protein
MMAENRDYPRWSRTGRVAPRPEPRPAAAPCGIDLDRLVWDQEYRDEVRLYLKTVEGEG